MEETNVMDLGDLELCFGRAPKKALDAIEECADKILEAGKRPLAIVGKDLVTLGHFELYLKSIQKL